MIDYQVLDTIADSINPLLALISLLIIVHAVIKKHRVLSFQYMAIIKVSY